jgi:hypothetical protein
MRGPRSGLKYNHHPTSKAEIISRMLLNTISMVVIGLGALSTPAAATESEAGAESCDEIHYYHCYLTSCAAYRPCSISPGDGYHGCTDGPSTGAWYARPAFLKFNCNA